MKRGWCSGRTMFFKGRALGSILSNVRTQSSSLKEHTPPKGERIVETTPLKEEEYTSLEEEETDTKKLENPPPVAEQWKILCHLSRGAWNGAMSLRMGRQPKPRSRIDFVTNSGGYNLNSLNVPHMGHICKLLQKYISIYTTRENLMYNVDYHCKRVREVVFFVNV